MDKQILAALGLDSVLQSRYSDPIARIDIKCLLAEIAGLRRRLEEALLAHEEIATLHGEGLCIYDNRVGVAFGKLAAALRGEESDKGNGGSP